MDAEALKRVGNEYFKKEKYQAAIDQYTSAIVRTHTYIYMSNILSHTPF